MALERKNVLVNSIPEREEFIRRGFDYQETELAAARAKHAETAPFRQRGQSQGSRRFKPLQS
jgi:hypothetical protein